MSATIADEVGEAGLGSKVLFAAGIGAVALGRIAVRWKDNSNDQPALERGDDG